MSMKDNIAKVLRMTSLMPLANSTLNVYFGIKKKAYKLMNKPDLEAVYNIKFFDDIDRQTVPSAKAFVNILMNHFNPKSVIDMGCGRGVYLKFFKDKGVEVYGTDGSKYAGTKLRIAKKEFAVVDLRKDYNPIKRYDLCLCIAVGEHTPESTSKILVNTLTKCSDTIIFVSADKGCGGSDHINEQSKEYWLQLFDENDYYCDETETETLKKEMNEAEVIDYIPKYLLIIKRNKA
jgi:2-polyprenyl-3-methyl-5-hydroxy-6-metoxy-1,4-benzoquinol methylase